MNLHSLVLLVGHLNLFQTNGMDVVDLDFIEVVLDTYLLCMHEVPAFVELIMNYLKPVLA